MDVAALLLPIAVALGAISQRVTGVGFALVASPLLVLVAGPFEGVLLSNLLGLVVTVVVFLSSLRQVEWRRGLILAIPAVLATIPGAWVAKHLPSAWLEILVGGVVLIALTVVRTKPQWIPVRGKVGAVTAGAASGFMNVTAGVGGPAMVLYALSTKWEQVRFAATFQFYAIFVNLASLVAKGGVGPLRPQTVAIAAAGLVVGLTVGHLVSKRVTGEQAQRLVIGLALVGSAATLAKGIAGLA